MNGMKFRLQLHKSTVYRPQRISKSDVLRSTAPIIIFSFLTLFAVQNRASDFEILQTEKLSR